MNCQRSSLILVSFLLIAASTALSQNVEMLRLSEKVIVLNILGLDSRTNIVVISSRKGLVVIDTEISPYVMNILKRAAEKYFGRKDWAYAINTHGHIHHVFGNCLFKDINIIGHERIMRGFPEKGIFSQPKPGQMQRVSYSEAISNLRQMLRINNDPLQAQVIRERIRFLNIVEREWQDGFEMIPPNITFRDRLTLDLGDIHLRLIYWGEGINHSSVLINIMEENILVSTCAPRVVPVVGDSANLSNIQRWISLLKEFTNEEVGINTVVSFHNDFISGEDLRDRYEYLNDMLNGLTEAKKDGFSLLQVKDRFSLEKRYARFSEKWSLNQPELARERHQNNIDNIWNCLGNEK